MEELARKIFTVEEANKTLPLVKNIIRDIIAYSKHLNELTELNEEIQNKPEIDFLISKIKEFIYELNEIGCEYKGIYGDAGLVDFPSVLNGQPILLCWKSDETEIKYFHSTDTGFSGRKIIDSSMKIGEQ